MFAMRPVKAKKFGQYHAAQPRKVPPFAELRLVAMHSFAAQACRNTCMCRQGDPGETMVLLDYDDRLLTAMGLGPMINHIRAYLACISDFLLCWS